MKLNIPKIPKITIYGIDIIKNFIFFTVFIIITLLVIAFIISPTINNFKSAKKEYFKTKSKLEITTNEYKERMKELKKIKNGNKKILMAFKRDFNEKNFKLFASRYMKVYSIKKIDSTKFQKDFIKTTYIVKSAIKTPKNFYDFIDKLKNYKYILRVYFPIEFIKQNKEINLTLKIEHYKLAP